MDVTLPKLLDASGNEVRRLHPISLSISENIIPLTTANMTLMREDAIPDRSWVELFTENGSAGKFRTRTPTTGYGNNTNSYQLEHGVCEVGDWLVRADIEQVQKTLSAALTQVFAYYGGSKWQLGTVSASGNVILSANYSNVLQTMNSLIAQVQGAMMSFDFTTSPWTINVVTCDSTVSAEGRLSRNVASAQISKDDSNLCTRVYLEGLTGGKMDADTISSYGVIERKLSGRDYTAAQAATVASAYLAKNKNPKYTITIDGADFSSITGETLDRVAIGKLYRLAIPEDNITINETIISISWKDLINSPRVVSITLSQPETTLVEKMSSSDSSMYGAGGDLEYQARKNGGYSARIAVNERDIQLVTEKANENGDIIAKAGMSIDPDTGAIIYAENQTASDDYIGSRFKVQADKISIVVNSDNSVNAASIVAGINNQDETSSSYVAINADRVYIAGVSIYGGGTVEDLVDGTIQALEIGANWFNGGYMLIHNELYYGPVNACYLLDVGVTQVTIDGVSYNMVTATGPYNLS